MSNNNDACPVDHKAREVWLAQARAAEASKKSTSTPAPAAAACPVDHSAAAATAKSWSQTFTSYLPWSSSSAAAPSPASPQAPNPRAGLDTDRVVSSIPRSTSNPEACPVEHGASANAEIETGSHASGNWVYPSEKMFFEAMQRKGYDARTADMKTVVPIHNAVNERAWKEILEWEKPYTEASKYVATPPQSLSPSSLTRVHLDAPVPSSSLLPTRWRP